jgi:Leucine-rich repeat (LRR) protein
VTNRDKKDSVRARMAYAGEPFNVARRKVEAAAAGHLPNPELLEIRRTGRCDLSNRGLAALPPEIAQLTNLWELRLGGNQLTALPPEIGQLTNLMDLRLEGNRLTALPRELASLLSGELKQLRLAGNPLQESVLEQYGQGPQALASYLRSLE